MAKNRGKVQLLESQFFIQSLMYSFNTSDPNFIVDSLMKRKSDFKKFINSDLSPEELINVLKNLIHAYNLKSSKRRSELLAMILDSERFVNNINIFLRTYRNDKHFEEAIDPIMYLVDVNINELPIYERLHSLLNVLNEVLTDDSLSYYALWVHELTILLQKKTIHKDRKQYLYRDMDVYPSAVDLLERKELMANKINGPYASSEEYVDTIFKLFKEDFEGTLRESILQMKAELRGAKAAQKGVNLYNNVNIVRVEANENPMNGIIHRITFSFDEGNNQFTNKRINYGSLLMLSRHTQFTTFNLAIVIEDVELQNMENSYKVLKISFVGDFSNIKSCWTYNMVLCKRPFIPYYDTLMAIQAKSIENFPMEKYIVHLDGTPCLPGYITTDTEYKIGNESIKLFGDTPWPEKLLNLDASQQEALREALTHEFVLIQGPPGSGKSYLARTIIDVLIDNKENLSTPILLISSDTYSVDNILESLVLKGRNVLKIGYQNKSEILEKHLLRNKMRPCGRDIKVKIERIKEALLRKKNKNEENIEKLLEALKREQSNYREACDESYANEIKSTNVEVIGGTAGSWTRLHGLLDKIQPEVVIVENANEISDAYIIPALSQGCKHIILIGDNKQLTPNIFNKTLENYDFNVSLFERMMRNGMKCCVLKEQHRMRPEIAALLAAAGYPKMKNNPVVDGLGKIRGMKKNMFFINHEIAENCKKDEENSFSNKHEAEILLGLANYLIMQGYSTKEITILVPYTQQLNYMTGASKAYELLKGIEILTIDTYSGHENTIILLSFVRSQSPGIGFLSNNNKIRLALSRAKSGLYMIGNMKTLMSHSELWVTLNSVLKMKQAIGGYIQLECETHKSVISVSRKKDYNMLDDAGCGKECRLPLPCGHLCPLKCHPLPEPHATFVCREPCSRVCGINHHECKKMCFEKCNEVCNEIVKTVLPCGHHSSEKKCHDKKDENEICSKPTIVSYLFCMRRVVPCWQANSCFYRKVEGLM